MLAIVRISRREALREVSALGLKVTAAQSGEIVAALFGYESHAELTADTKDDVVGSLLEISELVVLNEPLALRRAEALNWALSPADQKRVVTAAKSAIALGIEGRPVFDDVQHLYDDWAEKEIIDIAMQSDEVQAQAEELEVPDMDANPSFTADLWQSPDEWILYSYGTTKLFVSDGSPQTQSDTIAIYGLIRFRKAGRAGLMVDFADGGLDPRTQQTH